MAADAEGGQAMERPEKKVKVPLFNSYVFIRVSKKELYRSVQTDGVVGPVRFNDEPAPIRKEQIELICKILMGPDAFEIRETTFSRGDPVRIVLGPLRGNTEKWVNWRGTRRLAIEIEQLNHTFLVEVPAAFVEKEKITVY